MLHAMQQQVSGELLKAFASWLTHSPEPNSKCCQVYYTAKWGTSGKTYIWEEPSSNSDCPNILW